MQILTNQFQKELKQHGSEHFPFLVSYQKLSEYESGSFMWHWHPEIEITYVRKGTMCYKVNNLVYHLKEGDIVFNNSGALHSGTMENQEDCTYIPVTFDPRLIYGFFQSTINSKYVDPVIQDSLLPAICIDQSEPWHRPFREYLLRIIALDEKKPDFYELDITICLQSMWRLLLEHITYEPQVSRENSLEYDRIKNILSYIEDNYQNKITLNDIAGHIHLCESECTRLFKRHMNTTLFAFLQEYRIERSLEFLQADQPVSAVADKAGFSDPNYYSKVFAKIKGCSPREYRKHRF
ncbi:MULTISPECIES: AraC family transcriptional regulator [unclassified Ruminococcus]|uniref:AraC family transcriptional regulator n=1 Tax=unclassified Ruminococcus TaxID=2608920 RepID=UPI00189DF600|nr:MULTISPECIES: AraC family transcriptional regulator [unclassified Ruminococcus]MDB8756288.1 AraC family transcriptional regulator [Ruminococcus sp. 1001136sp1]MDB8760479.1 AraC family transcriptional regulator [Ruminococcus sp. 1001136sp1]MDB8764311.1 AraC family transcriptional regulator [Ruminococcus sp. 1001136sp1]MDB8768333.1 AraC family transcriptional regulator [Ruminococcus sp. 1001136sp1]